MAPSRLNVLVYSGTGSTLGSVKHALFTLQRLLVPNYAVFTIGEAALLKEPWQSTCALLVIPGGADLGYCRSLNGEGNRKILAYIRSGGRYLGLCAGAYYGSARCEFEVGNPTLEVVGRRELSLFPGICRGGAFSGFRYRSEAGARAVALKVRRDGLSSDLSASLPETVRSYYNGGGVFVDADTLGESAVQVLAEYADTTDVDGGSGRAAVVHVRLGNNGQVLLTGPHLEFSHTLLDPHDAVPGYAGLINDLAADEPARIAFLKACLAHIGLDISQDSASGGAPSPSALCLTSAQPTFVGELLSSLADLIAKDESGTEFILAGADRFRIANGDVPLTLDGLSIHAATVDGASENNSEEVQPSDVTTLYAHEEGWPSPKATPSFNHTAYYSSLLETRGKIDAQAWGNTLVYGEVVTSTNTILEQNPKLLAKLPTGFTITATTQIAGRGRGSNVWLAPPGQLIFSILINHPASLTATRPIVFIQYIAAIAIVEAIQDYDKGYAKLPVKIKWPNDIYCVEPAQEPGTKPRLVKIGGLLSNCSYSNGNYQVVLGIGINTSNQRPTTSLDALATAAGLPPFRVERLLARLVSRLEKLYHQFVRDGFTDKLLQRYYAHWLHEKQVVTLEAEGGVKARVLGITTDWGMLRAEEVRPDGTPMPGGKTWVLQSDENSFDFWKGLIKRKL